MASMIKSVILAMALYGCSALNKSEVRREVGGNTWGQAKLQVEQIMAKTKGLHQLKVQAAKY